jgi:hypothetical protein
MALDWNPERTIHTPVRAGDKHAVPVFANTVNQGFNGAACTCCDDYLLIIDPKNGMKERVKEGCQLLT